MDVKKAAAETKDYIVSIRREFHRHPELSLQEFRTAQRIEEELDDVAEYPGKKAFFNLNK